MVDVVIFCTAMILYTIYQPPSAQSDAGSGGKVSIVGMEQHLAAISKFCTGQVFSFLIFHISPWRNGNPGQYPFMADTEPGSMAWRPRNFHQWAIDAKQAME